MDLPIILPNDQMVAIFKDGCRYFAKLGQVEKSKYLRGKMSYRNEIYLKLFVIQFQVI